MSSRSLSVIVALAVMTTAACSDRSPLGTNEARLTIQLTDAPGDLAEAWVRFDRIVLHEREGENGGSGRLELWPDESGYINLLTLAGGRVLDLVEGAIVPTGTYGEMRVVLGDAWVRLNDGRVFATAGATLPAGTTAAGTLRCPSCSQSGFKIKFMNGGMVVADNTTVLIDFDVAQSFGHEAGRSGQWIMRPVMRATTRTIRLGSISGTVALAENVTIPACGGEQGSVTQFRPTAVIGDETITANVDAEGAFVFSHLMPGTYALGHVPTVTFTDGSTLSFTATVDPASVALAEGADETAAYVITGATCTPAP
jgi:hypothetical protein